MTKEDELKEVRAPIPPISPLFSNMVIVSSHTDMIMLDFGFLGPSYCAPYDLEDSHIARVCLDWAAAERLIEQLNKAKADYVKNASKKTSKKAKKV